MLKYLIIQLDDTSVSFCHYNNNNTKQRLIELDTLKDALVWSMKENLTVQFLYPDYVLPAEYKSLMSSIYHADIVSSTCEDEDIRNLADVVVFDSWAAIDSYPFSETQAYVIRTTFEDLFINGTFLNTVLTKISRFNIVITDIQNLNTSIENKYSQFLENLSVKIFQEYKKGHEVQINILTDRMMLDAMNNCGAGDESITLAPDGQFYICPGFYLDGSTNVGDVPNGLDIKNQRLYRLDHAPICRICDAWHCKRCVWQNKNLTLEVNTPGREQCVMAHIERNASRKLLDVIREIGQFMPDIEIKELNYMDPFEIIIKHENQ